MPRYLKITLISLTVLIVLLIAAVALIAAVFDPNDYKPQIIQLVQDKKQRTLAIPGDIKLTFFPKIGASLGPVSLSEPKSKATFASVDAARVSLALLPLLRREVVVDRVMVEGLRANLKRYKDGKTNFDDLLGPETPKDAAKPASPEQPVKLDIDGISLRRANIVFDDLKAGSRYELVDASFETGKIAEGKQGDLSFKGRVRANKPAADANVSLKTGYRLELEKQHYRLNDLALDIDGKVADLSEVKARFAGSLDSDLGKQLISSPQLSISIEGRQAGGVLKANLSTPVSANLKSQVVELPRIALDLVLPNPGQPLQLSATGNAVARLDKETLAATLAGKLDQSNFTAKFGMDRFSPAAYVFDLVVDQLDVDRYTAKGSAAAGAPRGGEPEKETPIDLSALKDLNARGTLRVGALKAANLRLSNVKLDLHAAGGKLDLNPITANLYQGQLSGSLSAVAATPPRFAGKQTLSGVSIGPLLKDAIGKDPLEGRGNVALDVTTQGPTVSALKKSLNGTARFELREGAVRGINIAQVIRAAKAKLGGSGGSQAGSGSSEEKTDFSELTGSFRIVNGVAHNDDLSIKSPLLRVTGAGNVDLTQDRLDYTVKASVVSTLEGQGGAELQALKGLTVPVKLSGPFTQIGYSVDFGGLVSDSARQKIEQRRDELKEKAGEQLRDRLKGLMRK
jgi:AsmA protein